MQTYDENKKGRTIITDAPVVVEIGNLFYLKTHWEAVIPAIKDAIEESRLVSWVHPKNAKMLSKVLDLDIPACTLPVRGDEFFSRMSINDLENNDYIIIVMPDPEVDLLKCYSARYFAPNTHDSAAFAMMLAGMSLGLGDDSFREFAVDVAATAYDGIIKWLEYRIREKDQEDTNQPAPSHNGNGKPH